MAARKYLPYVTALHLCADNDRNGNPRRCFVVLDYRGRFVEAIDEEYIGEAALYRRWPMFHWTHLRDYLGRSIDDFDYSLCRYPVRINVSVSEYKRFLRREPNSDCQHLRAWADKYETRNK